jgi:very-short-patch-repair endonuclease
MAKTTLSSSPRSCAITLRTKMFAKKLITWKLYYSNPKKCECCDIDLDWFMRKNKFCSHSCSAQSSNSKRAPRTEESRKKTSESMKIVNLKPGYVKRAHIKTVSKISFCEVCGILIRNKHRKTCSDPCKSKHLSKKSSERLSDMVYRQQHNYGRKHVSYLEKSFIEWLNQRSIYYFHEPSFKNYHTNKTYFPDFYFPQFKLIIELDGTQHNKTQDQDQKRDRYIQTQYGIRVVRLTHKDYVKKLRYDEICELLHTN